MYYIYEIEATAANQARLRCTVVARTLPAAIDAALAYWENPKTYWENPKTVVRRPERNPSVTSAVQGAQVHALESELTS